MHARDERCPGDLAVEIRHDGNDERLRFHEGRQTEGARFERQPGLFGHCAYSFGTYHEVLAVVKIARRGLKKRPPPLLRQQLWILFVFITCFA